LGWERGLGRVRVKGWERGMGWGRERGWERERERERERGMAPLVKGWALPRCKERLPQRGIDPCWHMN
jgi:hypothetical protein